MCHIYIICVTFRFKQCQLQKGSSDCGLFAFAFAAVMASGKHPSAFHFNQLELLNIFIDVLYKDVFYHSLFYDMEGKM